MYLTKRFGRTALALAAALALALALLPAAALAADAAAFTFTASGIAASGGNGSSYDIDGTTLKIKAAGVYTVTGTCSAGNIQINKGVTGVTLTLKDLTLANDSASEEATIAVNKGASAILRLEGTNTVTDNGTGGAAIKAKAGAALTVTGSGTLNVAGNTKNGIKSSGASVEDDGTSWAAAALTIAGGTIDITAANDGINAGGDLTLSGGTIAVSAGDDGIHSDAVLTLSGADVTVTRSYEGLEGAAILLNSGSGHITASDDGVNAASDSGESSITVNGGTWYVNASGDGLDAGGDSNGDNGRIVFNGGVVEVYGAANNGNAALDAGRSVTYNGGTVLAVGMSGMAEVPAGDRVLVFGSSAGGFGGRQSGSVGLGISAGSSLEIRDASGNVLYTATAVKSADSVIFATDSLAGGDSCTLYVAGAAAATATAGANSGVGSSQDGFGGRQGGFGGFQGGFGGPQDGFGGPQGGFGGPQVVVDGTPVRWEDAVPFIDGNGRTMVPLRAVGGALGLEVRWDGTAKEASFSDGSRSLTFPIGASAARTGDGQTVAMDAAAAIVNDRTYAPIRYLAEYFGCTVGWDGADKTVRITRG